MSLTFAEAKIRLSSFLEEIERNGRVDLNGIKVEVGLGTAMARNRGTGEVSIQVGWKALGRKTLDQLEVDLGHEEQHVSDIRNSDILGTPHLLTEQRAMEAEIPILEAQGNSSETRRMKTVVADPEGVREEFSRRQQPAIPDPELRELFVDWYLNQPFGQIDTEEQNAWMERIRWASLLAS